MNWNSPIAAPKFDTSKLTLQLRLINGRSQFIELHMSWGRSHREFLYKMISLSRLPKCCYYFLKKTITECKIGFSCKVLVIKIVKQDPN